MIAALRRLAAVLLAAPRDNPLVRYGSPARRLSVPRALWWLALGAALFFAVMICLVDLRTMATRGSDPYLWVIGWAALAMPLVAGISFLGFGFPYRQQEHLDELELAGLKPAELVVGFLFWPVVACGLVTLALASTPWLAAVASSLTNQVYQPASVFGWRVLASGVLALWAVLCLAVAFRAWMVRRRSSLSVMTITLGGVLLHVLWIQTLHVRLAPATFDAIAQYMAGWRTLWWVFGAAVPGRVLPDMTTIAMLSLLMLLACALEVWLAAISTWRLFVRAEKTPPRWLSSEAWAGIQRPSVDATTEWVLSLLLLSVASMAAIGELGKNPWFVRAKLYDRDGMFIGTFAGYGGVATPPGLIVSVVIVALALMAAWSVRWRLPSIDTRGRTIPSALVGIALLAAVMAVLYGLLAEQIVIDTLRYPYENFNTYRLARIMPFASSLVLTAGLSVVVLGTVRAARWPWVVAALWIAVALWVVWPATIIVHSRWYNAEDMGKNVFACFPLTGRSGLLWLILGIALCLWLKLRGVRGATPPR